MTKPQRKIAKKTGNPLQDANNYADIQRWTDQTKKQVKLHNEIMADSVDHITKDDPRFAEIAAQCTPISEISAEYNRFDKVFIQAPVDKTWRVNPVSENERI